MRISFWKIGAALSIVIASPATSVSANAASFVLTSGCGAGYYRDTQGHCVPRPQRARQAPEGASARCRDGTYSFSHSRRGTCSHHGGVATWL